MALRDGEFEELLHPPYSPDLAQCDFHLFPNLEGHFLEKHFEDDNELKTATEEWLHGQDKTLYLRELEKLCECYNKCIAI